MVRFHQDFHSVCCFYNQGSYAAQKMTFSSKGFLTKCDQIRSSLLIWSHLLRKSLMENVIFFASFKSIFLQLGDSFLITVNLLRKTFYFLNHSFMIVYREKEITTLY